MIDIKFLRENPDLVAKGLDPLSLRVCFLENRYRSQMDLTWQSLTAANQLLERWRGKVSIWSTDAKVDQEFVKTGIAEIFADFCLDLDTPRAMQKLREIEKNNKIADGTKSAIFIEVDQVIGLDLTRKPKPTAQLSPEQNNLLEKRRIAREKKDFAESDRLRDLLQSQGIEVRDNPDGQSWSWLI